MGSIQQRHLDNFSIEQLQAYLRRHPNDMYAGEKLIERLQQRNTRRRLPSQVTEKTARSIQQRHLDNFSIEQLQAYLRRHPNDMYAGEKLIERLQQRNTRRRLPS